MVAVPSSACTRTKIVARLATALAVGIGSTACESDEEKFAKWKRQQEAQAAIERDNAIAIAKAKAEADVAAAKAKAEAEAAAAKAKADAETAAAVARASAERARAEAEEEIRRKREAEEVGRVANARRKAVADLDCGFRKSLAEDGTYVLHLHNGSSVSADLELICFVASGEKYKTFSISVPAKGDYELGFLEGWPGNFVPGEWCEASFDGEKLWRCKK